VLIDFLFELRRRKIPVSTHEWMALMEAMALGLHESSLDGFYHLCRTLCVKDIAFFDAYDEAFLAYFKDVHTDALQLTEQMRSWLRASTPPLSSGSGVRGRSGAGWRRRATSPRHDHLGSSVVSALGRQRPTRGDHAAQRSRIAPPWTVSA